MLEIVLTSSALIAVLALLRLALRGRVDPRLQYALWALVLLRLLIPVSLFKSDSGAAAAAGNAAARVEALSEEYTATVLVTTYMGRHPVSGEAMIAEGRTWVSPLDAARGLWYAGMAVCALWFLFVNLRLALRLRRSRRPYACKAARPVYVTEGIPSPFLFGLFCPTVYLTESAAADPEQARQIIAHELTHLRHGDCLWAALRGLCLVVYWFDPFVWLAASLSRRDAELACDAATVARLGEERRYDYGRTLLGMATVRARASDLLCGATTMTGGARSLRERIRRIAEPKVSLPLCLLTLALAALAAGCAFTGAAEPDALAVPEPTAALSPQPVAPTEAVTPPVGTDSDFEAFYGYLREYLEAYKTDIAAAADYRYAGGDAARQMFLENVVPIDRYTIDGSSRINDGLWLFHVVTVTGERQESFNQFVGRMDARFYVFPNADVIPDALTENLGDTTQYYEMPEGQEVIGTAEDAIRGQIENDVNAFLLPAAVQVGPYRRPLLDADPPALSLEELLYGTDAWEADFSDPPMPAEAADAGLVLTAADGSTLYVWSGVDGLYLLRADGSSALFTCGLSGNELLGTLYNWAAGAMVDAMPENGANASPSDTAG